MKKVVLALSLLLLVFLGWRLQWSVGAAPEFQTQYATPTALPDGRIIYIVQPGDTCLRISLLTGVSVDYLRVTNQLNERCDLRAGQQLLIGIGGPASASPTPGPTPTPMPTQPTPTPGKGGSGEICVLLYLDANGDALRQETEMGIEGGAVSIISLNGQFSQTQTTVDAIDPLTEDAQRACFANLQPGFYTVSAAAPDGYNPTTVMNMTIEVAPGDVSYLDFGAQLRSVEPDATNNNPSPVLGIFGFVLIVGGIGLGIYTWVMMRQR
ncbi:MAG: LysM peptidoglycan-binding domain-containing protein [Anaerolineales bacterium]|nr:LysM peptidoglycan-binding domain-containing protein [Anaerolineales bacterium]MCX7608987.1 LysM peptidoglycan-binding domain-containing protein [Anaerolineales bacterium]MDW8227053.1 LysM peptidoglycan-binding domain-containing protein [Anaerolineales bacterium]